METVVMSSNTDVEEVGFEMEDQNLGGEQVMEESTTGLSAKELEVGLTGMATGFGIGLGAGLITAASVWFWERNKRLKMLKAFEETMIVVSAVHKGLEFIVKNEGKKKEEQISIKEVKLSDIASLVLYINENIDKVKMSKKEKTKWKAVIKELIEAANTASIRMQKEKVQKELEATVVQESVINKNAQ